MDPGILDRTDPDPDRYNIGPIVIIGTFSRCNTRKNKESVILTGYYYCFSIKNENKSNWANGFWIQNNFINGPELQLSKIDIF